MKYIWVKLFLIMVVSFSTVSAESRPKAMIIFDASGSMWGQIDGVNKIVIARDALKSVVQKWNPKVELGLTVYGHRIKGDCNDIQTILPIAKVNKKQMIDTVFAIQPKGMTPIAKSLRQVANSLRQYEDQTTIILISDGRESCEEDPCATAKQLKAEGINFVAHVVGFNVDASTDKQLACVAKATGGEYFSAKNAVALNKAIKVIAKKVAKPKPKPKPSVLKNTTLELIARYQMSPAGLNVSGMQWEVTQGGKTLYSGSEESPKIPAKVGKVHIKAGYNRTSEVQKVEGDIALRAKKNNPVIIQLKSGKVTIDTAEEQGGPKVKSSVRIYPILNGQPNISDEIAWCVPTKSKVCDRVLPTGDFLIQATYDGMKTQKQIVLGNKEKKSIHLYFKQTGKVYVTARETEGGKLIDASCRIYNDDKSDWWTLSAYKKNPAHYTRQLPTGKYTVNCSYNEFKKENIPVEIKSGETSQVNVVFGQTGKVYATARETEGGKLVDASCRIYNDDKSDWWTLSAYKKNPAHYTRQLPTGTYTANCSYNDFDKENMPLEIKSGETSHFEVLFPAFFLQSKCANPNDRVGYEIYAKNGELVYDNNAPCSKKLKVTLSEGTYSIEGKVKETKTTTAITVYPKENHGALLDFTQQNHAAVIQADTQTKPQTTTPSTPKPVQQKIQNLNKAAEAITKTVNEHKDDIEKMGDLLNALGGMMGEKSQQISNAHSSPKNDTELNVSDDDLQLFSK